MYSIRKVVMKENKAEQVINEMISGLEDKLKGYREVLDRSDANNPDQSLKASQQITKLITEIEMLKRLRDRLEGA